MYDRQGHGLPGEAAFYVRLARAADLPVLELGCGTGRVTLAIAAAGVEVVGLDLSPAMLRLARAKAASAANPTWIEGDMRRFTLPRRFGLVIAPYRLLQLARTDQEL